MLRDQLTALLDALEKPWHTRESACGEAGIGTSTFYRWMQTGRQQKKGEYREFRDAVKGAEAKAKRLLLVHVSKAGMRQKNPDWRALVWIAERRWFREFGQKRQTILTGDERGGPVKHRVEEIVFEPEVEKPKGVRSKLGDKGDKPPSRTRGRRSEAEPEGSRRGRA